MLAGATDDAFHALADGTRRVILDELADRGEETLYGLCVRLVMNHGIDMTRQAVRKHLAVLEDAGFVETRREGKYKLIAFTAHEHLDAVRGWLDQIRKRSK